MIASAEIYQADEADGDTVLMTVESAREQLEAVASPHTVEEVLGDKGYHQAESLAVLREVLGERTYLPEQRRRGHRVWTDKPPGQHAAVYANRRRCASARGAPSVGGAASMRNAVSRTRAKQAARRRSWLRGITNVAKRYWVQAGAHNLGALMRALYHVGTPRSLQGALGLLQELLIALWSRLTRRSAFAGQHGSTIARIEPLTTTTAA